MAGATNQTRERTSRRGPGPLLSLLVLFDNAEAAAGLFRRVRWANGIHCPKGHADIAKFCKYEEFQRYTCKTRRKTFNDKTGTILHCRHISLGNWMLAVWMYFCGLLNGIQKVAERVLTLEFHRWHHPSDTTWPARLPGLPPEAGMWPPGRLRGAAESIDLDPRTASAPP